MTSRKKQPAGGVGKATFEGRTYVAESQRDAPPRLEIDGLEVPVERAPDGGFESIWMPHRTYSDLDDLARDIIRFHPQFKKK